MKKYLLFFLAAIGSFFLLSPLGKVQAAPLCCPGGKFAPCTINTNPCDISGDFTSTSIGINANTASPLRINLTGNLNLMGTDLNFQNQFAGASNEVVIDGRAPAGASGINGKNIDMTGGNINYPTGGLTIDLSVPDTSTGNGGYANITGASGTSDFPANATLKIYTQGSNAAGGSPTRGGDVNIFFSSNTLLSGGSLIKTGNTSVAGVDGGAVRFEGSGNIGIESLANFIVTSSSNRAGDVTIKGSGYFKGGIHANSCENFTGCGENGGTIDLTGLANFYAPSCVSVVIEAKGESVGGNIEWSGSGFFDLPATTATGTGGTLKVTGATLSNCSCKTGGGACWNQLSVNNGTINFNGESCDESNPMAACSVTAPVISNITSTNPDGFYKSGAVINITVKFSAPVAVTGSPTLELETGAVNRKAVYIGGSGTDTLAFRYNVQPGDGSSDLDYTGTGSLDLNGGSIKKNASAIDASIVLPAPGAANSLGANKDIIIDTTVPSASIIAFDKNNNIIANGATISDSSDANPAYFHSTAWDNIAVANHIVKWITNGSPNEVNCGSASNCWVRVQGAVPAVSYSTESAVSPNLVSSWTNCAPAACSVANQPGSFTGGNIVKYQTRVLDAANNLNFSAELMFIIGVPNIPPTVSGLSTNENFIDYCAASSSFTSLNLSWNFNDAEDASQNSYKLKITRSDGLVYDPGIKSGALSVVTGSYIQGILPGFLRYNSSGAETYSWEVTVYDSAGASDGPKAGPGFSFPKHKYPDVGFAPPPPASFLVNTSIDFQVSGNADSQDNTKCYPAGNTSDCKQWIWDFDYDGTTFTNDKIINGNNGNWEYTYTVADASYKIVLRVTDKDGYTCDNSDNPEVLGAIRTRWKEVIPR